MREVPVTEARAQLSDLINQVAYGGQPVLLTRHGKPLVALVPAAGLGDSADAGHRSETAERPMILDLSARETGGQDGFTIAAHHPDAK